MNTQTQDTELCLPFDDAMKIAGMLKKANIS
jgi:hypothetical protein